MAITSTAKRERKHRDFVQGRIRSDQAKIDRDSSRHVVAKTVLTWSFSFVVIFGLIAIVVAYMPGACSGEACETRPAAETANKLLNALLPIISGWVGAVIAYYFVERVQERAEVTRRSYADHVSSIPITSAMLTMAELDYIELERGPVDQEGGDSQDRVITTPLTEVLGVVQGRLRSRVPIFEWIDENGGPRPKRYFVLRYVLHESTIFEFLHRRGEATNGPWRLEDLFKDPVSRARLDGSIAAIPQRAALADAKAAMDRNPRIQDVVVTLNGRLDEPFVGWLTNISVLRRCVAGATALDGEANA